MSPKQKITKQIILEATFQITREKGAEYEDSCAAFFAQETAN
ncbi:MAG: hypothetical protein K0S71_2953 [Clostridia bacterium]|jgi:hypothetical protein|nr:hypothetical protein [Clostridia bacterium]